jgi:hypothetical protein
MFDSKEGRSGICRDRHFFSRLVLGNYNELPFHVRRALSIRKFLSNWYKVELCNMKMDNIKWLKLHPRFREEFYRAGEWSAICAKSGTERLHGDRGNCGCSRKLRVNFLNFPSKLIFSRSFVTIEEISHFRSTQCNAIAKQIPISKVWIRITT